MDSRTGTILVSDLKMELIYLLDSKGWIICKHSNLILVILELKFHITGYPYRPVVKRFQIAFLIIFVLVTIDDFQFILKWILVLNCVGIAQKRKHFGFYHYNLYD